MNKDLLSQKKKSLIRYIIENENSKVIDSASVMNYMAIMVLAISTQLPNDTIELLFDALATILSYGSIIQIYKDDSCASIHKEFPLDARVDEIITSKDIE